MSKELTDTELDWAALVKAIRSQVRLKHSTKADRELNGLIARTETEYMAAVKSGKGREFVLSKITEIADAVA